PHIIATYRDRCAIMLSSLREAFGDGLSLIAPEGGMFIWASWQDGTDASALLQVALRHNVMYVPGSAFYATRAEAGHWRLS
ncbi:PLP-dependent aminotransferase family protein, partial [Pseudarthrobacter equi]|nr:PLP-dependent aminotransferase family protein [Pseudarthrobacter equi]